MKEDHNLDRYVENTGIPTTCIVEKGLSSHEDEVHENELPADVNSFFAEIDTFLVVI